MQSIYHAQGRVPSPRGAAPPALIQQMAHEKKVDIKGIFDQNGHYVFRNFTFLAVYEAATSVLANLWIFIASPALYWNKAPLMGSFTQKHSYHLIFAGKQSLGPAGANIFPPFRKPPPMRPLAL